MKERHTIFLSAWFALTKEERWLVAGVLGLALLGLSARYLHLRRQTAEPIQPPGLSDRPVQGAQL